MRENVARMFSRILPSIHLLLFLLFLPPSLSLSLSLSQDIQGARFSEYHDCLSRPSSARSARESRLLLLRNRDRCWQSSKWHLTGSDYVDLPSPHTAFAHFPPPVCFLFVFPVRVNFQRTASLPGILAISTGGRKLPGLSRRFFRRMPHSRANINDLPDLVDLIALMLLSFRSRTLSVLYKTRVPGPINRYSYERYKSDFKNRLT